MARPKVSVIVPAYNIENFIERCLNSLINQTLKEIEVIVVNDGSKDGTLDKIQEFANTNRIVVINQKNQGTTEARKSGLNRAIGEYVLFVDGDDWLEDNSIEILYEKAIETNSDIILFHAFKAYTNRKEVVLSYNQNIKNFSIVELLKGEIGPELCYKFVKLDYIRQNNIQFPSNISFAEDLATNFSLFINNPKVSVVNTALYNYYIREDSITNKINSKVLEIDDAFDFIKITLIEYGVYDKYKELFGGLVYEHIFATWTLRYALKESVYSRKLYRLYKKYHIGIYSNPYIREKLLGYSIGVKLRVICYHHSYRLGTLYDRIRGLTKRERL